MATSATAAELVGQAAGSAAKGVEIYKWVMRIFTPKKLAAFPSLFQANRASGAEADIETTWASQKSQRELAQAISRFRRVCWKIGWEKLLLRMGLKQVPG